jgi:hypothetical protein
LCLLFLSGSKRAIEIFHQLTAVSELPTVGFLRACQRRSRVVIDLLRESPSLEPEQALGLQHLVENAERVASDNFGYISFGQTLGS